MYRLQTNDGIKDMKKGLYSFCRIATKTSAKGKRERKCLKAKKTSEELRGEHNSFGVG